MTMQALKLSTGDDGIVVLAMDLPGRSTNVVCEALLRGIAEATARLADGAVKGLVLTCAKADFCTGGSVSVDQPSSGRPFCCASASTATWKCSSPRRSRAGS